MCGVTQIISALSVLFIVVSILSFCLKTHPNMRVPSIQNLTLPFGVEVRRARYGRGNVTVRQKVSHSKLTDVPPPK